MGEARRVNIPHVAALDGLRGVAVAGVLLFHGGHLTGGYLGVDLFFVLSGFLITSLLLAESGATSHVNLGGFWARRARRLLPALVGLLVGIAFYCVVFAEPSDVSQIRGDALATLGYVANWRAVFSSQSYWELFRSPSPLEHTWSLAIEEQFYLVWPLVFVGLLAWWKAKTPKAVLVTALVLAALSTVLMLVLYDPLRTGRVYYGTDTRATGILLGAALAAWLVIWGPVRTRAARIALEIGGLIGIGVLAVAWSGLDGEASRLYQGGFLVCGIAAIAVIAASAHPETGPIGHVLSFRPLCWLGLISYGVYLWHWPVDLVVNPERSGLTGWPLFALQTAIALAIAVVSYQFLEMPIRRGALRARQWTVVVPAVALGLVALIVVATANPETGGASSPVAAAGSAHTKVLVFGDSIGQSLVPGLEDQGLTVIDKAEPGCRIVRGDIDTEFHHGPIWSNECTKKRHWTGLLRQYQPDAVFLDYGTWDLFDVTPPGQQRELVVGTPAWTRYYRSEVERVITIAGSTGAIVVLPNVPCFRHPDWSPTTPTAFNPKRAEIANRILAKLPAEMGPRVVVPDLSSHLCPGGRFQGSLPGAPQARIDGMHFTRPGANVVAGWLLDEVKAQAGSWLGAPTTTTTRAVAASTSDPGS